MPRPRRRGAALLVGAALLFVVGTSVQAGWILTLSSVVLGTAVAGAVLPFRFVGGVGVERRAPAEAFQGDEVEVELVVRSRARGLRLGIDVVDAFLSPGRVVVPSLARGEAVAVGTVRRALRRGVHEEAEVLVCSAAPFGVVEARRSVAVASRTIVYPTVVRLAGVPLVDDVPTFEHSIHTAPRRGGGPEYLGIREYRVGDSMRHVHWPSTAHHGQVMVREFEREHTRRLAIVLDTSADGGEPVTPLDAVCSVAASLAFAALGNGHGVRLIAARDGRVETLSRAAPAAMLTWLAELRAFGGPALRQVVDELPEHVRGIETLVLALPSWRSNAGLPAGIGEVVTTIERVAAVVVDAATFAGAPHALAMSGHEVDALTGDLVGSGIETYRFGSGEDLSACLTRPLVGSR